MHSAAHLRVSSPRLFACLLFVACLFPVADIRLLAQTAVPDAAIPQVIVPSAQGSQFFVLNKDRSVLGASTYSSSTYSLRCAASSAIASQATANTPVTFNDRSRYLFEAGQTTGGGNIAIALGADYSGTNCTATNSATFNGTNATQAVTDTAHQRTYVISDTGGNTPDILTHFSTDGNYYSAGALNKVAQAALDTGGSYSSMAVDFTGDKGYVAVTQLRTDSSSGGLWVYDPIFGRTVKVLGPGGKALPSVGSFILHNPQSIGGNLLVLVNQDNLSAATIGSPTPVTTPFTIIDLGQLGALLNQRPTDPSVTLPFVTNISSNLNYYAVFGAAYNPVDGRLYLVTGGGTSTTSILKQVVRYDPTNPSSPAETPVADLAAVPLNFGSLPKIVLNGSANTLQLLTANPNAVYTVGLATGDTAMPVAGSTFGDGNFQPTFIATNPLMGETYIASGSGQIDILTLPADKQRHGALTLDGPNATATSNQSTSVRLQAILPVVTNAELSGTITITATAASSGQSFTFAANPMNSSLDLPRYVSGTFPADDFYALIATWPGSANYPAVSSPPVVVAVGKPQFTTQITAAAAASSSTDATASVTLTGTTYAPTGTIAIKDGSTGTTLKTYFLPGGSISNSISVPFTFSAGTTSITATYSGDAQNGTSTSSSAAISGIVTKSATTLTLSAPTAANTNTSFNSVVSLGSANGTVPTGQVVLYATPSGSTAGQIGSAGTSAAFGAGASVAASLAAGTYTLQAKYDGDTNFSASASNSITIVVTTATAGTVSVSPTSLAFSQALGTTSDYKDVTVSNGGGSGVTLSSISITGTGFVQINGCGSTLAAGARCTVRITFAPAASGNSTGTLTVRSSAASSPTTVALTGTGYIPLAVAASATSFADTTVGTSSTVRPTVTFTNNSGSNVTITQVSGTNAADVEPGPGCVAAVVANGSSCTVLAIFHPASAGSKTGDIVFTAGGQTFSARFTGTGLPAGACTDTDGDALCDDWEKNGMWSHTAGLTDQFIDLPGMGADPNHKDLFVHVDWMQSAKGALGEHSHQLKSNAQATLVTGFNDAPVKNPDGTDGIHLHIDCGPACIMNPVTNATWGTASKAAMLDEQAVLDAVPGEAANAFDWTVFDTNSVKFKATGRALVFHHAIMAHDQKAGNSTSGVSRNGATRDVFLKGGSDFNVTLGSWNNQTGTDLQQGGTLMHELGHNLSLEHGGRDEDNYKPNYLSVMNYNIQTSGLIVDGNSGYLDYSRWTLPAVNEFKLSERTGINADPKTYTGFAHSPSVDHYGTYYFCKGDNPKAVGPQKSNTANGPINFDCDSKNVISTQVATDINASGGNSTLASNDDWSVLVYSGGAVGGNGVGVAPLTVTPAGEITQEQNSLIVPPYGVAIRGMNALRTAPGTQPTLRFTVSNTGSSADTYKVTAGTANGWAVAAGTPATLSIPAGGQAEVAVTYAVPASAASGDGDMLTFRAVSQNAPRMADSVEVNIYAESSPAPLAVSAASLVFGSQVTGSTSGTAALVLVNTGTAPLSFPTITATAEFAQTNTCPAQLQPMASCTVNVSFLPSGTDRRTGTLTIVSSASATPIVVALAGTGNTAPLQRPAVSLVVMGSGLTKQPTSFTVSAAPSSGNIAPGGTVTIYNDSSVLGEVTLDKSGNGSFVTAALGSGVYNLYASYAGDSSFAPVNTPYQALTLVDNSPTGTTLKSSIPAGTQGTPVTFTATVAATTAGAAVPTGTVTFYEGTTSLGTGTLSSGSATFTTSALALGAHSVTASYGGDAVSQISTSTVVTVTVSAATVTLSASPSSLSVTSGNSGTVTLTATPNGSFTGSLSFSCGMLPAHTACRFSLQTLAFAASATAQTTTLTITTRDNAVALLRPQTGEERNGGGFAIVAAVFLPLGLLGMAARRRGRLQAGTGLLLLLVGAFAVTVGLSGCGSSAATTTMPGTYSVPVVATANGVSSQITVSVTVQ